MSARLHTSASFSIAWENVFLPWHQRVAADTWQRTEPVLVVVPFRSDAYFLKARLLATGAHALGIHFVTPAELRERLTDRLGPTARAPIRENLQLLLAAAAERIERDGAGVETLAAARAVAAAPDHLLKAIDQLSAGGWRFDEAGPAALRPIVAEFTRLMKSGDLSLLHDADRELLRRARKSTPAFAHVFIAGFTAQHWPLWPLLGAAVTAASEATVCLLDPRGEAEQLDATWIGTWEEAFGAAEPIASDVPAPRFAEALRLPETPAASEERQREPVAAIEFLVGENTREQARAIVTKALQFLASGECTRLGILFPAGGALARTVSALLAGRGVPHNDGIAHFVPGELEHAAWPAWLQLQESALLETLIRFLRSHGTRELFEGLAIDDVEQTARDAFGEILIDDIAVLAKWLERREDDGTCQAVAAGLRAIRILPPTAPLASFIEETLAIFRELGWTARAEELTRLSGDWTDARELAVSRRAFLRWLGDVLVSFRAERDAAGNHPYSRVHLLSHAQASTQAWSHLVLAGLNEGRWPPLYDDAGYIGEEEIDALNARIRVLNTRAVKQGRHGEGHWSVKPGKALCLGPAQKRALALRQFLDTIEAASGAVAVTASLHDESAPDRLLNPSDFFTRLYFCARGLPVSQSAMTALRHETAAWLEASGLWERPPARLAEVAQTRRAFDARRDASRPFGEYEFSLRRAPSRPIRLAAKRWEDALGQPAIVWMDCILGIAARKDGADDGAWNLATGTWVHRWLAAISSAAGTNTFAAFPSRDVMLSRVRAKADAFRDFVENLLAASARRALPDWWISGWQQARAIAESLARRVAEVEGCTQLATEWRLESSCDIRVADHAARDRNVAATLHTRGRIDLILAPGTPSGTALPADAWIVDYKTGKQDALTAARLLRGEGVQLALYALALHQLGTQSLRVSLLTPRHSLEKPLTLADIEAQAPLWQTLLAMQESGAFGMRGPLRSEFRFTGDYPLATLAIDEAILDEKWMRTHPGLAPAEESE